MEYHLNEKKKENYKVWVGLRQLVISFSISQLWPI